jgi:hypothetical protein
MWTVARIIGKVAMATGIPTAAARLWWDRIESQQTTNFNLPYWLALSSLFWIEGRLDEARETWKKGNATAKGLSSFGSYEFERHRLSLLYDCIESDFANVAD